MSPVLDSRSVNDIALGDALAAWAVVLGSDHVLADEESLRRYSRSTLPTSPRPLAVVRPATTEDVRRVVNIATQYGTPLYPVSRGRNWGYGDACPVTSGQVIVDLCRMNRIVEVSAELAYAVVEPGVTQGQMSRYLQDNHCPRWLDMTGAGPDASIVGNTLERGFGHTPYGDHFQHTCGMEIVLADGRILNTGFGAYSQARAAEVFPWGIGPWLDGLFTQSNLGIVTRMGVWLLPVPEAFQAFLFRIDQEDRVTDVIDALRELRLQDVVRSTVHVANDLRVLSSRQSYPWELMKNQTPLPAEVRRQLRRQASIGAWNVMGGLYGTKETVAAARHVIGRRLGRIAHVHFFHRQRLDLAIKLAPWLDRVYPAGRFEERLRTVESVFQILCGQPSAEHLSGVFWRSRDTSPRESRDPSEAGVMWLSPVLPLTGAACREFLDLVEPVFGRFGFEPLITITSISSRAAISVMSICYDKENPGEAARAEECYGHLFDLVFARGYLPYRVGIASMHKLAQGATSFWETCQQIKRCLDPSNILAPGRYQPLSASSVP